MAGEAQTQTTTFKPTPASKAGHHRDVIFDTAVNFYRMLKRKADALDEAFLKTADPRAVQGGATCEEADEWRKLANKAAEIICLMPDQD